jgi:putative DNA primase/helicase
VSEQEKTWDDVMAVAASEKIPTFDQLREDAECLKTADLATVDRIISGCVRAKLDDVRVGLIVNELNRGTKLSKTDLRSLFKAQRRTDNTRIEDLGQKIVRITLSRFYMGGEFLVRSNGRFYEFTGTHWVFKSDEQVAAKVLEVITSSVPPEAGAHAAALSAAMSLLKAHRTQDSDVFRFASEPHPVINCRNGELWINADGTVNKRPHSPRSYLTYCLDFDYDPEATCPLYDRTLLEIFAGTEDPEGMARHWNEFFGYAIQPVRDIPSWWMLWGIGANGKSRLVETIQRMIGAEAVASVRIESLDTQFGRSPLLGKLIMVDDDVDAGTKLPDGVLKQISERKRVSVEFKGQTPFDAVLTVLPIMLCNSFPVTSDVSYGMRRRAQVIPFDRQFEDEEQDKARFPTIWRSEMSGVLNRAIEGLRRLRARGRFLPPAPCSRAAHAWLSEANPLSAFVDECLVARKPSDKGRALRLGQVYAVFVKWAELAGVRHITARKRMKANLDGLGIRTSGSGGEVTVPGLLFNESASRIIHRFRLLDEADGSNNPMDFSNA